MDEEVMGVLRDWFKRQDLVNGATGTWEAKWTGGLLAGLLGALRAEGFDVYRPGDCAEIDVEDGWVRGDDATPMTNGTYRLVPAERGEQ